MELTYAFDNMKLTFASSWLVFTLISASADMSKMTIRDYYKGKSILLTGGTGFMGKVLIEKLLYSIPDIGNIYVITRPKRGKSINQRLEAMQMLPLFDRLRNEKPSVLKKMKALQGDLLLDNFGLSEREIENLSKEVSVFFHFAATLKLEAPLKDNVNMNTCGTRRALNVAKKLENLEIFVHLSTAFCYPDYEVLGETIHAPPADPKDVMHLIELLDDKQLELITPSLLRCHPNCYTYSKRLAESIVSEEHLEGKIRTAIVRPSIVCPAVKEPLPGWVDSLNGPIGVMLGAGKGVIRTMLCDGSLEGQVIPVDTAINAIIAVGMIEGTRAEKPEVPPIYNANIAHQQPTTWGEVLNFGKTYSRSHPMAWPLWYPNGDITTNPVLHETRRVLYHLLPAYLIDLILFMTGQKRFMVRIQDRISQGLKLLQFFTLRPWTFLCPNFDSIQPMLDEEEKVIFNTDLTKFERNKYLADCIEGGRIFCFKESPTQIPMNRRYHNFLYVLDWIVKIFLCLLFLSFLVSWFRPAKTLLSYGGPVVEYLPLVGSAVFDK